MTRKIFKYDLPDPTNFLKLPVLFEVLTAQYQRSVYGKGVKIWIEVDSDKTPNVEATFFVLPTGAEIPKDSKYISTVSDGTFIFHVYQYLIKREL